MNTQHTLSIIKPDAVAKNVIGKIYTIFEEAGLKIIQAKLVQLSQIQAEKFYDVHRQRPFFKELVEFMISGPVMVQVLEGENAIEKNRQLMGDTNPENAAERTIRKLFAENIGKNAVHGSDSIETAKNEIAFFFAESPLV